MGQSGLRQNEDLCDTRPVDSQIKTSDFYQIFPDLGRDGHWSIREEPFKEKGTYFKFINSGGPSQQYF